MNTLKTLCQGFDKNKKGFSPEQKANISLYQIWEKEIKERMMQKAANKLNPKERSISKILK